MFLSLKSFVRPRHGHGLGGALLIAGAAFAAGLAASAMMTPSPAQRDAAPVRQAAATPSSLLRASHPADVLRVVDGDTFEARVRVWPGMDVTTKIRLRGIDAPEMRARCAGELASAEAARNALARILAEGAVGVMNVSLDRYGGRVVADAATRSTANVSSALLDAGLVRRYGGGRRESWCQ